MNNETKQTAVMKLLQYILVDCRNKDGVIQFSAHETFNEYLEMEKEQMDKVSGDWWVEGASYMHNGKRKYETFEQYYNETFNK
jgi:hypothetical protein